MKIRREIVELTDRLVMCGIDTSRSRAINIIDKEMAEVLREVEF